MTQWKFGGERRISDEERREALNIVDAIGDVEAQTGSKVQGVVLTEAEIEALLAVATLYVDSFKDDEAMTLPERMRLQEIEDILDRHGRRY